ncbi:conserved hypothetical protein [Theileria equi strain WA]|uniref:C2H2-type domain-containing protein n=1 Tax=Theileria equi strain WA TaxID=1537102 RepID=L1LA46_THEEQ|nr:conserved hypothetical protein [Theileria equi strain WA]EKX72124.1 conserved hypothetical protein [Theileria equi strain WA]|eukprot:XP_004831576.1 conserved hypothetical protein [Theileria equi strain WA]
MGRKSRKRAMIKPFCYFCNREFDNEKILIQHQKAKHFKCEECNRKLETANGLLVHMQQVHKMVQRRVPNAIDGRDDINCVVQGMHGVPPEVIQEFHIKQVQRADSINNKKQQRISWTQVAMAPSVEQFLTQMRTGNTHFPGMQETASVIPAPTTAGSHSTPMMAAQSATRGGASGFSQPVDIVHQTPVAQPILQPGATSGVPMASQTRVIQPLILGPKGVPVEAPEVKAPIPSRFTAPVVPMVFEKKIEPEKSDEPQTLFYKACGFAPLFVPTPALGNTRLSYSSDSVSINNYNNKIHTFIQIC